MGEVLQYLEFNEAEGTIKVYIKFIIRSKFLIPADIGKELNVKPSHAWQKDDEYLGKTINEVTKERENITRKRPFGLFEINTLGLVASKVINDHVTYLHDLLNGKSAFLTEILKDPAYTIIISVYKESIEDDIEYQIDSKLFSDLVRLSHEIHFINEKKNSEDGG